MRDVNNAPGGGSVNNVAADFDVAIENLLGEWEPRIGRPTCGPGCAHCCERMTVTVSSAEALGIVELTESRRPGLLDAISGSLATLAPPRSPDAAIDALLDLGSCAFLDAERRCTVYEERPDACRACYVWHPAEQCGRREFDMCTPAELNALRVDVIHSRMLAELDAGRRPFWGQIAPMVDVLARHRRAYRDGMDLHDAVDPAWLESELIEFPQPGGSAADIRGFLEAERATLRRIFEEESSPMGYPRGAEAPDRDYLAAFPLD